MPVMGVPTAPFKLTPEDMGAFNAPKAVGEGASVIDTMIGSYLKNAQEKELQAKLPYAADTAAAALQKAQIENQFQPDLNRSLMELQHAQAQNYLANAQDTNFQNQFLKTYMDRVKAMQNAIPPSALTNPNEIMQGFQVPQQLAPIVPIAQQAQNKDMAQQIAEAFKSTPAMKNAMEMPAIPNRPVIGRDELPQTQQLIPGTNLPSSGDPTADAWVIKKLGITPFAQQNAEYKQELAENLRQNRQASSFDKLPLVQKNQEINQAGGFGYEPDEAIDHFRGANGKQKMTLKDMAQKYGEDHPNEIKRGFDPNNPRTWPAPKIPLNVQAQNRIQNIEAGRAVVRTLAPRIEELMGNLTQYKGYAPELLAKELKGMDDDKVGDALAGAYLSREMNLAAARAGGMQNVGIETLREMGEKGMTELKQSDLKITPKAFKRMMMRIREATNDIADAELRSYYHQISRDEEIKNIMGNQSGDNDKNLSDDEFIAKYGMGE